MKLKMWIASLLLAFAPAVAGAVTLNPGPDAEVVAATSSFTFTNDTYGAPLSVSGFGFTFQNPISAATLNASTWTFTAPDTSVTGPINFVASSLGSTFIAAVNIPDFTVDVGQSFTIAFMLAQPGTSGSFSFNATPVPLPAAGWMLLSALGGVAAISRRRKAA